MTQMNPEAVDDALANPELIKRLMEDAAKGEQFAAKVHRSLLPSPVKHPQIDVDVRYVPINTISGNYCQVRFPEPTSCYITMCDVSGQGIVPALLATRVSTEVRHLILDCLRPMEIVRVLNEFIYEHFHDAGISLSFVAVQIDLNYKTISYSSAGHPGLILCRPSVDLVESLTCQNSLIGLNKICLSDEPENTRALSSGDRLLLCTSGLIQVMDADARELGQDGLEQIASDVMNADAFDVVDRIMDRIELFCDGPPQDDMTLIMAELR